MAATEQPRVLSCWDGTNSTRVEIQPMPQAHWGVMVFPLAQKGYVFLVDGGRVQERASGPPTWTDGYVTGANSITPQRPVAYVEMPSAGESERPVDRERLYAEWFVGQRRDLHNKLRGGE